MLYLVCLKKPGLKERFLYLFAGLLTELQTGTVRRPARSCISFYAIKKPGLKKRFLYSFARATSAMVLMRRYEEVAPGS